MLRTLKLLRESKIVKSFEILDFKSGRDFYFFKIKVVLYVLMLILVGVLGKLKGVW